MNLLPPNSQALQGSDPCPQIETLNRNICNFVWYGVVERGVAGEGLRSVGVEALPSSKSVCSILPLARHLRAGASYGVPALSFGL